MHYWLYFIPFIAAFIGWIINSLLIQVLFHPIKPIKILGFNLCGLIPAKRDVIAAQLGKYVSEELFSFQIIEQKFTNPANIEKIMPVVEGQIDHFLRKKLAEQMPMLSMFIGDSTVQQLKNIFMEELSILFPQLINQYAKNLQSDLDLEKIVSQKIISTDISEIEKKFNKVFQKEISTIKFAGALTGLFIGVIQVFLTLLIS